MRKVILFFLANFDGFAASSESSLETFNEIKDYTEVRRDGGRFCHWVKSQLPKSAFQLTSDTNFEAFRVPRLKQLNSVDFRNCQCSLILDNIYKRLLYHSKNSGQLICINFSPISYNYRYIR